MDGALGRDADIAVQSANQELANLASTPMGFLALQGDNQALDLGWQLVGIAHGAARAIRQRFAPAMLVALEDLAAGLAGDPELPADLRHRFAIEQFRHKPQALVHHRTLLPRHRHLPLEGGKCYLCVRYALLPMSRAAQRLRRTTLGRFLSGLRPGYGTWHATFDALSRAFRKVVRESSPGACPIAREVAPIERNHVQHAEPLTYRHQRRIGKVH